MFVTIRRDQATPGQTEETIFVHRGRRRQRHRVVGERIDDSRCRRRACTVRGAKIVAFDEFLDLSELMAELRTVRQRA